MHFRQCPFRHQQCHAMISPSRVRVCSVTVGFGQVRAVVLVHSEVLSALTELGGGSITELARGFKIGL